MKKWLSHLVYISLMIAGALYFQGAVNRENRRIHFLNCPTDEAYLEITRTNSVLRDLIGKTAEAYPSPSNTKIYSQTRTVDSLVSVALVRPEERDGLAGRLRALTGVEPANASFFDEMTAREIESYTLSAYQKLYAQNDSLCIQMMYQEALKRVLERISGSEIICFGFDVSASFTTLCPEAGDPFEADFLLSDYRRYRLTKDLEIRVNDEPTRVIDGLAQFEHTFPDTGLYPLHVRARYRNWSSDSVNIAEKTFFLRVNR